LWTLAGWGSLADRAHLGNAWNRSGLVLSRPVETVQASWVTIVIVFDIVVFGVPTEWAELVLVSLPPLLPSPLSTESYLGPKLDFRALLPLS